MELLSSINNSGIGAQYAISAAKDVNGNEITSTYLTAVPEGYATESFVTSQGYITGSYLTADALDNVSGTWNTVTNKLDSTAFSTVSGNFLTAHQSLPNSADWNAVVNTVNGNSATWNSTYDTVHDNSASWTGGGGASVTSPRGTINVNGDQIEGTNSAVLTGTAGGYEAYLLAYDNHIDSYPTLLTNNTLSDTAQLGGTLVIPIQGGDPSLYITVTGETFGGGTATASGHGSAGGINFVYIPLGEMKGPFTAQSTYWVNLPTITLTASAAPTTGITGVGELAWNSALNSVRNLSATWNSTYNTVSTNSASWGAGASYTGDAQGALDEVYSKSGDWNTVTDKLNSTAFSTVSGNFLTAVPEGYATTGDLTSKLDSTAFSTVSGSFLTAHQALPNSGNWDEAYTTVSTNSADWNSAAAMNELPVSAGEGMDIQNVDGNIVFSCTGGSVPEGVLVESGLEYDDIEISGYSGSAFKDVALSETVATNSGAWGGAALPISAGPGVKVELTDGKLLFSTDETVLFETTTGASACTLSEPMTNFKSIKILYGNGVNAGAYKDQYGGYFEADPNFTDFNLMRGKGGANVWWSWIRFVASDRSNITIPASKSFNFGAQTATAWQTPSVSVDNVEDRNCLYKVVGINRTAGGN